MKIVIVDTTIDEELIGGGHLYIPSFMKNLIRSGHEVHFVTKGKPNKKVRAAIEGSGAIQHSGVWDRHGFVEKTAPVFAKWVNELAPDIYFISSSADIGWVALPLLDPSIATISVGHSNAEAFYLPAKHYKSFLSGVVGVSGEICSNYKTISGIGEEKIEWIPYGVESSDKAPEPNHDQTIRLVYAGRLEDIYKRASDLAPLIKKLSANKINYKFSIVGDGSRRAWLENELSEEIKSGQVEFTGWINNDELLMILRSSDIFILVSDSEGFSISMLEAMANGCCPLLTNIPSGSIQIIRDGHNGYLLEVGDVDGFANKIISLSTNRAKLFQMRTAAWETGKEFTVARMGERYEKVFEKGIKQTKIFPRKTDPSFPLMESCISRYPQWIRWIKVYAKRAGLTK